MERKKQHRRLLLENLEGRRLLAGHDASAEIDTHHVAVSSQGGGVSASIESAVAFPRTGLSHHEPYLPDYGSEFHAGGRRILRTSHDGSWASQFADATPDDVIVVEHDVVFNDNASAWSVIIDQGGALRFDTEGSQRFEVVNLQILPGGLLEIGTPDRPHLGTAEVVFRDEAIDLEVDPGQYGNGLVALGTVTVHGRPMDQTFVRTAGELRSGDSRIEATGSEDWSEGDQLVIPDTRQAFYTAPTVQTLDQYELSRVSATDEGGVDLVESLGSDHLGARDRGGSLRFQPVIGNLTRNVLFRSANPEGVRGHTIFIGRADIDIRYAEFRDLGRTVNADTENTRFNPDGTIAEIGSNPTGRYPIHFHHLIGPAGIPEETPQYRFTGNSVWNETDQSIRWGIAIHGSHYGVTSDNVVYNVAGAGIVTEDGTETGNTIERNFVTRIPGTRARAKFSIGDEGWGFWFKRPNNRVNDNVVSGADKAGYGIYGGNNTAEPPIRIPAFKGANPHHGEFNEILPRVMHVPEFARNEVFASSIGLEIWYLGYKTYYDPADEPVPQSVISEFRGWHINKIGAFIEQTNNTLIENMTLINAELAVDVNNISTGVAGARATATTIVGATIENFHTGLYVPNRVDRLDPDLPLDDIEPFRVVDSRFRNGRNGVGVDIQIGTPIEDAAERISPRYVVLESLDFNDDPSEIPATQRNIVMSFRSGRFHNIIQQDVVEVIAFDRDPRQNFRLFYNEQSPDYVVPQSGLYGPSSPVGAPVAGLTNQELWDQFGLAVAGEVAPDGADSGSRLSYPSVEGLAFPLIGRGVQTAVLSIHPDTGRIGDRRTAATELQVSGVAPAGSVVTVFDQESLVGTTVASAAGLWTLELTGDPLASGSHSLVARSEIPGEVSSSYDFEVFSEPPVLLLDGLSIPEDTEPGSVIATAHAFDLDANDTLRFQLLPGEESHRFAIDSRTGEIRLARTLDTLTAPEVYLTIEVEDSVGLVDRETVLIRITERPPGFWVTQLDYSELSGLTPDQIQFLTPAQIETIPNAWWFERIAPDARASLRPDQLAALNTSASNMLSLLTFEQRVQLPAHRYDVPSSEFEHVPVERVEDIPRDRIRQIQGLFSFRQIPAFIVSGFTQAQLQAIDTSVPGVFSQLSVSQREQLTPDQYASLGIGDYSAVPASRVHLITEAQLASLPASFYYFQFSRDARNSFNAAQVNSLPFYLGRILGDLTWSQREMLTESTVRRLGFTEFRYLPPPQILMLTHDQLRTLTENHFYYQIPLESRNALAASGFTWIDHVGFEIGNA